MIVFSIVVLANPKELENYVDGDDEEYLTKGIFIFILVWNIIQLGSCCFLIYAVFKVL